MADLSCAPFIRRGELSIERVKDGANSASTVQLSVIGTSDPTTLRCAAAPMPTDEEAQDADMRGKQPRCPQDAFVEVSQKLLLVSSTAVLACRIVQYRSARHRSRSRSRSRSSL